MHILAFDTSTEACSVALYTQGAIYKRFVIMPQKHNQLLLPMIEQLLSAHQLSLSECAAIAFGKGPGSFTGTRIAASVAQGISLAHNLPVISVSSLHALAENAYRSVAAKHVCIAWNAHMKSIYWGMYSWCATMNKMVPYQEDTVILPQEAINPWGKEAVGVGIAWDKYLDMLVSKTKIENIHTHLYPDAQDIAYIAVQLYQEHKYHTPENALPAYLENIY